MTKHVDQNEIGQTVSSASEYLRGRLKALQELDTYFQRDAILDCANFESQAPTIVTSLVKDMVRAKALESLGPHLVIDSGWSPNDFLMRQLLLGQGIYSGPTALYLWGLSDQYPYQVYMTFKSGYRLPQKLHAKWAVNVVARQVTQQKLGEFVSEIPVDGTQKQIQVYSRERTLVEVLRKPYSGDTEMINTAYKRYLKDYRSGVNQLLLVAQEFNMGERVSELLEVML